VDFALNKIAADSKKIRVAIVQLECLVSAQIDIAKDLRVASKYKALSHAVFELHHEFHRGAFFALKISDSSDYLPFSYTFAAAAAAPAPARATKHPRTMPQMHTASLLQVAQFTRNFLQSCMTHAAAWAEQRSSKRAQPVIWPQGKKTDCDLWREQGD
jgi:hypothetical protein